MHDGLGDTLLYKGLARCMPGHVRVFGIEPHGTGYCPILHTRIPEMAAYYVQQIRRIQPEGPYFLGGLCAGGRIAFEMAVQLESKRQRIGLVALLDSPGPQMPLKAWLTNQRQLARFTATLRGEEAGSLDSRPHGTIGQGRVEGQKFPILRGEVPGQEGCRRVPLPDAPPGCRPWPTGAPLCTGSVRPHRPGPGGEGLRAESIARWEGCSLSRASGGEGADEALVNLSSDSLLGWGGRFRHELEIIEMSNGHNGMLHEPDVGELARYLTASMDQTLSAEVAS